MKFNLPWPPSINHYYATFLGRRVLSKKGRDYKINVSCVTVPILIQDKVSLHIFAYPPDRRKRDLDNILKPILDSLVCSKVIIDDSQIDEIHIIRKEPVKNGSIILEIDELT